jgi:hypothetical protein
MDENRFFTGEGKRERAVKQEKKLALLSKGNTTINSGATLGDADVSIKQHGIRLEAKYTDKAQITLTKEVLKKLKAQSRFEIPMMEIQIEDEKWYVIRPEEYFLLLELFESE